MLLLWRQLDRCWTPSDDGLHVHSKHTGDCEADVLRAHEKSAVVVAPPASHPLPHATPPDGDLHMRAVNPSADLTARETTTPGDLPRRRPPPPVPATVESSLLLVTLLLLLHRQ